MSTYPQNDYNAIGFTIFVGVNPILCDTKIRIEEYPHICEVFKTHLKVGFIYLTIDTMI